MAYGFNLGQIEGLDSSVQTVTLTIANATESNTYTLTYVNNEVWADLDNTLTVVDGNFHLQLIGITDSNLGEVYNITLTTESIEPNFKVAVEEVIEENTITIDSATYPHMIIAFGNSLSNITSASAGETIEINDDDGDKSDELKAELHDFVNMCSLNTNVKLSALLGTKLFNLTSKITYTQTENNDVPLRLRGFPIMFRALFFSISGYIIVGTDYDDVFQFVKL